MSTAPFLSVIAVGSMFSSSPTAVPIDHVHACAAEARIPTPEDPTGKRFEDINFELAEKVCRVALRERPGDPAVQANLARVLNFLHAEEAMQLLRSAVSAGNAQAMISLGSQYETVESFEEARALYQKAASLGHPVAMRNLGLLLVEGLGGPKDARKAYELFRTAAERGYADAMVDLAASYRGGEGVQRNSSEGMRWLRRAEGLGSADAAYALGEAYYSGDGAEHDFVTAMRWFLKPARAARSAAIESRRIGNINQSEYQWRELSKRLDELTHVFARLDHTSHGLAELVALAHRAVGEPEERLPEVLASDPKKGRAAAINLAFVESKQFAERARSGWTRESGASGVDAILEFSRVSLKAETAAALEAGDYALAAVAMKYSESAELDAVPDAVSNEAVQEKVDLANALDRRSERLNVFREQASRKFDAGDIDGGVALLEQATLVGDTVYDPPDAATLTSSLDRLDRAKRKFGQRSLQFATVLFEEGQRWSKVDYAEVRAEMLLRHALALRVALLGWRQQATIETLDALTKTLARSMSQWDRDRVADRGALLQKLFDLRVATLGETHALTLQTLDELIDEAPSEELHRKRLSLMTALHGHDGSETDKAMTALIHWLKWNGRPVDAEPLQRTRLERQIKASGETSPEVLSQVMELADTLRQLGRAGEAEALYRRTLSLLADNGDDFSAGSIKVLAALANTLRELGRADEAEAIERRTLGMATLGVDGIDTIPMIMDTAETLKALDRFADAEQLNRIALLKLNHPLFERSRDRVTALTNLAGNLRELDRPSEAIPVAKEAHTISDEEEGTDHPQSIRATYELASDLQAIDRAAEAEPLFRQALNRSRKTFGDVHPQTLQAAAGLASTLLRQNGREYSALEPATLAFSGWRSFREKIGTSARDESEVPGDSEATEQYVGVFADAAWASTVPKPERRGTLSTEVFTAVQDAMAGRASQAISLTAAHTAAERVGADVGKLARERQTLSNAWWANDLEQTRAIAQGGPQGASKRETLRNQQAQLVARMDSIDARLRQVAPEYFTLIRPEPLSLSAAQEMLAPDEAVVLLMPTSLGTHVLAVTKDHLEWRRSDWPDSKIDAAVASLRNQLTPGGLGRGGIRVRQDQAPQFNRALAHELFQQLFTPIAEVMTSKKTVYIASTGALAGLPMGVLVTEAPRGDDGNPAALRATAWLADRFALVQVPTLQSLELIRRFEPGRWENVQFAGFGDPLLRGKSWNMRSAFGPGRTRDGGAIADVSQLRLLAPLPGTATELENMRREFHASAESVRLREKATETAIKARDLSGVGVLALATHGILAGEIDGAPEPGLVLTPPSVPTQSDDGLLTASEITSLRLKADWIILSACNTAAGDGKNEGLSGLAKAFFYAGARSILASHWPIRDDVASELTVATIRAQRGGLSRAEALQVAMRRIRNDPKDPSRAHPSAWAPFSLIGEGR